MGHDRFVIKNGKTYCPYMYESYRDKDGKVQKRYFGKHLPENKGEILPNFFVFLIILLMIVSISMIAFVLFKKFF